MNPPELLRVIPGFTGAPERYLDLTELPWSDRNAVKAELSSQGCHVQQIFVEHPIDILVAVEIRRRMAEENK